MDRPRITDQAAGLNGSRATWESNMSGTLTFGYLYDFRNPAEWRKPWHELYAETLDLIAWTEDIGFEGAWVPEHHLARDGYVSSTLTTLAAIAARTRRLRLGSAIALAPLHHPLRFAEDCAAIDILSNGRLDMGVAIGYRKRETAAFGVDFSRRGRMFDEWLEIVTRLWAGETVDFDGQFYQLRGAMVMPPAPRGRIPLFIGGFADKAIDRVVSFGDGYIGNDDVCAAYVGKLGQQRKDAANAKVRITGLMTVVAEDPEAAMEELAPYFLQFNNSYGEWFMEDKALGIDGFEPMTLDQFKSANLLEILTPEAAIAKFKALQERLPLEHFMMTRPPGLPAERFRHYAGLFATKVIPAFR